MPKDKLCAYSALAEWFEYLNDDCGYEEWSQYLLSKLTDIYPAAKGLDIGCGSGYFTRALKRAGYDVCGMDISREMLTKAEELSSEEKLYIPYIMADVTSFTSFDKFSFAVAVNDCFNYISKDKLETAFKRVKRCLLEGGLFLFDISSEKKLKEKVAGIPDIDDRENVTYFSFNSKEGDKVTMDATLFVKQEGDLYKRFDERHSLYIYSVEEIKNFLGLAGFTDISAEGYLGEDINFADRIVFSCRKRK